MSQQHSVFVDQNTCSRCMACVDTCPSLIYIQKESGEVDTDPALFPMCITCGQCMSVCPTKSAKVETLDYEKDFFIFSANFCRFEEFRNTLVRRRSVRAFKDRPLAEEDLEKIISVFRHAPFGVAPENAEVTIVNSRQKIEQALPLIRNMYNGMGKMLGNAFGKWIFRLMVKKEDYSTIVDFLYPMIKDGHYTRKDGKDTISRGAPALMLFHGRKEAGEHTADSWILCNYAMIAANQLGIGSTIIGLIPPAVNQSKTVRQIFGIPEGHHTVCCLILGYPKHRFLRGFKAVERTVHFQ